MPLPHPPLGPFSARAPSAFSLEPGLAWDSVTLSSDGGSATPSESGRETKDLVSGAERKEKLELQKNLKFNCYFGRVWKWFIKEQKRWKLIFDDKGSTQKKWIIWEIFPAWGGGSYQIIPFFWVLPLKQKLFPFIVWKVRYDTPLLISHYFDYIDVCSFFLVIQVWK